MNPREYQNLLEENIGKRIEVVYMLNGEERSETHNLRGVVRGKGVLLEDLMGEMDEIPFVGRIRAIKRIHLAEGDYPILYFNPLITNGYSGSDKSRRETIQNYSFS